MLAGTARTNVFTVTGKAAFFPCCSVPNDFTLFKSSKNLIFRRRKIYLFTKSCSFCIGSGSPSLPQARTSFASYTRIMRSDVLIKNELENGIEKLIGRHSIESTIIFTHSPRLANSMLLTAVALDVPTVILKLASISNV